MRTSGLGVRKSRLEASRLFFMLSSVGFLACSGTETPTPSGESGGGIAVGGGQATGGSEPSSSSSPSGGGPEAGGAPSTGGSFNSTGGVANATGGVAPTGGSTSTSATKATGGSVATGGAVATGGSVTIGGSKNATGGTPPGGAMATGGKSSNGGAVATGGSVAATGGKSSNGGALATGGSVAATGGKSSNGGAVATGGSVAGGGAATGGGTFVENSGSNCNATSGPLLSSELKTLPDPFAMHSGTRISAKSDWECRRNEILQDLYKYEIGPKPDPSQTTVTATLSGTNLSIAVQSSSGSLTIKSAVTGSGSCVLIGTDMNLGYVTGCTTVVFSTNDVIAYNNDTGSQNKSDPFYTVFPSLWGKIGNYVAWAWGVSRMIDGLDQVKDQLKIDMTKIVTHGCSYAGKMSLFAGALDERVALVVVEESGGGGIDAWRASQDFTTRTGTSVEKIDNTNYAWFMSSMKSLDPYKLPHDHHELIAAIAPRATIILGNPGYDWLGDESGYKSTMAAVEVFKALGIADHIGYDFTGGHSHCSAPTTQQSSISAFVNKFAKGQTTANTNIAIQPSGTNFNLSADYTWTAPTLQ